MSGHTLGVVVVTGRLHLDVQAWLEWVLCLLTVFPMDSCVNVRHPTSYILVVRGQWTQSIHLSDLNLQREKRAQDTEFSCIDLSSIISYALLYLTVSVK